LDAVERRRVATKVHRRGPSVTDGDGWKAKSGTRGRGRDSRVAVGGADGEDGRQGSRFQDRGRRVIAES
jgi:hypothetical protein